MLKSHKSDLHGEEHSKDIHTIISHIEPHRIPPRYQQDQNIQRDQVDYKHVSSPRRHHIEVPKCRCKSPSEGSGVNRLDKQVESEQKRKDSDALIVIGPSDGPRDVSGADGNKRGGDQSGSGVPDLLPKEVGHDGCVGGEEGRREDADVADMDGKGEEAEDPVDEDGSDHEARVERAANDPAERVPTLGVEPVPELVEAIAGEEEGGAVVEVRIELMDHGLVAEDAEEANGEGEHVDEGEGSHADQELLLLGLETEERLERRRRGGRRRGFGAVLGGLGAHGGVGNGGGSEERRSGSRSWRSKISSTRERRTLGF